MAPVAYPPLVVVADGPPKVVEGSKAIPRVFVEVFASVEHMLRVICFVSDYAIWAPRLVTWEVRQEI